MYGIENPDSPVDMFKLLASIKEHEGLRLQPYTDTTGHLSIGYGRNLTEKGISQDEANFLLGNDLQSAITQAEAQPWWPNVSTNDARARAFIEIIFNIGLGALASFSNALAAAMQSDWNACSTQFRSSLWYSQVGNRAVTLCSMIENGHDPQPNSPS